jgi:outer membrane murein-binding lipoprotein Lpp
MEDVHAISGAILLGMGAIAGSIKWSAGRLMKAQDRGIAALVESAKTGATLTAKFDMLASRFDHLAARFDQIVQHLSPTPAPRTPKTARRADTERG